MMPVTTRTIEVAAVVKHSTKVMPEAGVTGSTPCLMNEMMGALSGACVRRFDMQTSEEPVRATIYPAKAGTRVALAIAEV